MHSNIKKGKMILTDKIKLMSGSLTKINFYYLSIFAAGIIGNLT